MAPLWFHLLDIAVCAVVLRVLLGWLVTYPNLVRFALSLVGLAVMVLVIQFSGLPLATILAYVLILPAILLLILSFLPELARVYSNASRGRLFKQGRARSASISEELATGLVELARLRRGALVVLPQDDPVEDLVSGGVPVDGRLSVPLLLSIFDPHSPGHDGAVVVRGNRIEKMGCVLPLSTGSEGSASSLGTRHLAALGLSERCDAVVICVSEERGTISIATRGRLEVLAGTSPADLVRVMDPAIRSQAAEQAERGFPKGLLWPASVAVAVLGVWGLEAYRQIPESPISEVVTAPEVRVTFQGLPEDRFVEQVDASKVKVFLRLPEDKQSSSLGDTMGVNIDLSGQPLGASTVRLSPDMVRGLPRWATVDSFQPDRIQIRLAPVRPAELEIRPNHHGLPAGLRVRQVSVEPATVRGTIRDSRWSGTLPTSPIDLSNISGPGTYEFISQVQPPPMFRLDPDAAQGRVRVVFQIVARP
jgi:DNA integrity scanning protein DisA with diadenylate cyclase activity